MIIEPFRFAAFRVVDNRDLSEKEQRIVTNGIRDGFAQFPKEYQCEFLKSDTEGDYQIMRFAVFRNTDLIGTWWMGCNIAGRGHTNDNAKIFSRPSPGIIQRHIAVFWRGPVIIQLAKHMLSNVLPTRTGGTLEVLGFDFANDAKFDNIHGVGNIALDVNDRVRLDPFLNVVPSPLGGKDNRVTFSRPGPPVRPGRP